MFIYIFIFLTIFNYITEDWGLWNSNIINNQIKKVIDTPGIKDTDNTDQENEDQLVKFLLNITMYKCLCSRIK